MIGILFITIPTIEYGGYFLLSRIGRGNRIRSETQRAFFRAGHAHAGVLVILAMIAQLMIEAGGFTAPVSTLLHFGFFLGAPKDDGKRGPLAVCVYVGAIILALSTLGLGLELLFAR